MISYLIQPFLLPIFAILLIIDLTPIRAIAIDDYHCKVPTCRDFYYVSVTPCDEQGSLWLMIRVWDIYLIMKRTKTRVTTRCSPCKPFLAFTASVSTTRWTNWILDAFVCLRSFDFLPSIFSADLDALAAVMKNCVQRMKGLNEKESRYYCGYTLMKYCAVHLGLDRYRLKFNWILPVISFSRQLQNFIPTSTEKKQGGEKC